MGYYSSYEISIKVTDKKTTYKDIAQKIDELKRTNKDFFYPFDLCDMIDDNDIVDNDILFDNEEVKWYNSKEDLLLLSTYFPDIVFMYEREGEEHGDVVASYFKGGKIQKNVLNHKYAEYDESKLE